MTQPLLQYGIQTDRTYGPYYSHSGKVTLRGALLATVAGLAAGFVAAWAYAYTDIYVPYAKLHMLACLAFGALIGVVPAMALRWGKVRNVSVALAIVGVLTLLIFYLAWCAWIYLTIYRFNPNATITFAEMLKQPKFVWRAVLAINEVGTWSMGSSSRSARGASATHGTELWVMWAGEAVAIFACSLLVARSLMADSPFCEACERWCGKAVTVGTSDVADLDLLRQRLERRDFTPLSSLGPAKHMTGSWLEYSLHRCATCARLATLTVTRVKVKITKKGAGQPARKVLLNKLRLEEGDTEKLAAALSAAR